jgi:retron-type reverse transcriptase
MNIGEMQRSLSRKAEGGPSHRFGDLSGLICREDWLRLARDYVGQNAGSKTAGCDGVAMSSFEGDRDGNLAKLQAALRTDTLTLSGNDRGRAGCIDKVHVRFGGGSRET